VVVMLIVLFVLMICGVVSGWLGTMSSFSCVVYDWFERMSIRGRLL